MTRLSYASTKNKDVMYRVRMDILDDFFMLETDKKCYVFLDSREFDFFKEKNTDSRLEAVLLDGLIGEAEKMEGLPASTGLGGKLALHLLNRYAPGDTNIEVPAYFPLPMADFLRSQGIALVIKNPFCSDRAVKEPWEADAIGESIRKTCVAYEKIEEMLSESAIAGGILIYRGAPLTSELLKKSADRVLFELDMLSTEGMIISSGPHSAIPHHPGGGLIRANTPIVCDLYPLSRETGYFADMTRTYAKGAPHKELERMYGAVLRAQEKALSMMKPGARAKDIHEAVCGVLTGEGFHAGEAGFTHSTGHGLGLDIHEHPRITKMSETILEPGHVITVEPGLYYPEYGGVRIEDVVCITDDGYENLTNYPKRFVIP